MYWVFVRGKHGSKEGDVVPDPALSMDGIAWRLAYDAEEFRAVISLQACIAHS